MNIETREIRAAAALTAEEKASGKWIPVRRKYAQKQPITDADFARIIAADERRKRRAANRAASFTR
jgi:hypothetical protein